MNNIEQTMQELGLTKNETKIYLAGLQSTHASAHELAKQTGIKRPTVYHTLESLMLKGLTSKKNIGSRHIFIMSSPEQLKRLADEKIESLKTQKIHLDELIPMFESIKARHAETLNVQQFDGIDGIKMVVEEALYCRSRTWNIIAPQKNFFSEFDPDYAQYYLETRKRRKIKSRSLWEGNPNTSKTPTSLTITPDVIEERNPRYMPSMMHGTFNAVMIVFDDTVAIISSYKTLSAILIKSREIHALMAALFEGLWASSIPPRMPK